MEYRRLGSSGLQVSAFSFGAWVTFGRQLDVPAAKALMSCAYDAGVNFFDNAEAYEGGRAEEIMGQALAELGWDRSTWCVSSKVFWGGKQPNQWGLSRKHVMEACHAALRRLQVDYLDLYFCHRPDPETPIAETVAAMSDLVRQGKVLYWGTSEWPAADIMEAHLVARENNLVAPTMEQPQYNLLYRDNVEKNLRPLFERFGMGSTIWSPLSSGILTGKYNEGIPEDSRMNLPGYEWLRELMENEEGQKKLEGARRMKGVADKLGVSMTHLALAWCLKNPHVSTVILGATKIEQLQENLAALDVLPRITAEVQAELEAACS
jgi:voltage-dependent potassium channel beta subunit